MTWFRSLKTKIHGITCKNSNYLLLALQQKKRVFTCCSCSPPYFNTKSPSKLKNFNSVALEKKKFAVFLLFFKKHKKLHNLNIHLSRQVEKLAMNIEGTEGVFKQNISTPKRIAECFFILHCLIFKLEYEACKTSCML